LNKNKLMNLLKMREGSNLDFKLKLSISSDGEKKELTRDVIAMANSMGGRGYLIFGIEDKTKKVVGIQPSDFPEETLQQIIYNRCDPPIPISIDFVSIFGKTVAVMTIYRSEHKPHQMIRNGAFYIRRGSTTDVARRNEIADMFQQNGILSYETIVLRHVSTTHLDYSLIHQYFSNLGVISEEKPNDILLESMGIIGKLSGLQQYHPTIGGILLFGKNPVKFLPHCYIKIIHEKDIHLITGNIMAILDQTSAYLESLFSEFSDFMATLKELIANALVHRDYLDHSRGILIKIMNTHITFSNPGALNAPNGILKNMKEKNSLRRNPWLYQRLVILDNEKRFLRAASGMKSLRDLLPKTIKVKFINIAHRNEFKAILTNPYSQSPS
jgi:ATP-dependent DNA helicase RecG